MSLTKYQTATSQSDFHRTILETGGDAWLISDYVVCRFYRAISKCNHRSNILWPSMIGSLLCPYVTFSSISTRRITQLTGSYGLASLLESNIDKLLCIRYCIVRFWIEVVTIYRRRKRAAFTEPSVRFPVKYVVFIYMLRLVHGYTWLHHINAPHRLNYNHSA